MIDNPPPMTIIDGLSVAVLVWSPPYRSVTRLYRAVQYPRHRPLASCFSAFPSSLDKDHGPVTLHLLISPHLLLFLPLFFPHPISFDTLLDVNPSLLGSIVYPLIY
jgi:hypothetical protein